ncbi:MAG: EAL domain-containing protein [Proteobacteria bacterium]|nr:EAL domain-containing protein [Pseudomonadota bacterium]
MSNIKLKYALYGAALALLLALVAAALQLLEAGLSSGDGSFSHLTLAAVLRMGGLTALGALLAFLYGGRLAQSVDGLNRSAERIGQGDYSQPIRASLSHEFNGLQQTLEQMRQRLTQTTVTRDYLQNIIDSMNDAVFVTGPDDLIRIANKAACRLTGLDQPELMTRQFPSLLDPVSGMTAEVLLQRASDSGETVLRTVSGQTIPVSISTAALTANDAQFTGNIYVARDITERKRAERRIRYLASHDTLTKIPNRLQFQHLLQQAIARTQRSDGAVAMLYLDMDRFKEVNDTFGHAAGDRVLEVLTERLTRVVPADAVMGRLAGDEFALFLEGDSLTTVRTAVRQLGAAILAAMEQAFHIDENEIFLSASLGAAFSPRDANNVIDLIRNADAAMYYSKQNGGNNCVTYSPQMNAAAVERLMLKSKLARAVERDELVVRYMPKVDLASGQIVGAEALLRWRLPGHGDIPPSQFIPLAEEGNLIHSVGEWVLDRVCIDYHRLSEQGRKPGRIALNLSLKQLRQASFILRCRSVFERHNVSPDNLELEITETTLMADPKRTIAMLNELRDLGLHLSIDDFGTGYSSLSALQQFPIGTLKIDQSFVRDALGDANDATLVRTIIEMGRSLGMIVVAEGIETVEQLNFLRALGCQQGQGKLFGEPCSVTELATVLLQQESQAPLWAAWFDKAERPALQA